MAVPFMVSYALRQTYDAILSIDEVSHEVLPDGRLKVTFVTSGIMPTTAKIKTTIWAIFGVPIQRVDEVNVEELQSGLLLKKYRITAILTPIGTRVGLR